MADFDWLLSQPLLCFGLSPLRKSFVFSNLAVNIVVALLAGCASNTPAPLVDYQPENFDASNVFAHHYAAKTARTCEAARRALLSQGYVLDTAKSNQVTGHKSFQPDSNHHVQLEFRVVCTAQGQDAGGGTMVFANGLQDQYSLRKTKESASLGVGAFGSLSLPLEGGTDEMVKVASQTVTDAGLYQRLFDLIESLLKSGEVPETPPPAATASQTTPAAAPVLAPSVVMLAVPAAMPASTAAFSPGAVAVMAPAQAASAAMQAAPPSAVAASVAVPAPAAAPEAAIAITPAEVPAASAAPPAATASAAAP
jgi:hypothetical protein